MIEVRQTAIFTDWLEKLRDKRAKTKITARIARLRLGNAGDVEPAGEGISEMRIHYGPGYRVYFIRRGSTVVVLLCGADKSTQTKNIKTAKTLAATLED